MPTEGEKAKRLAACIEEMAHLAFGLPRDARSAAEAREMAQMLGAISAVRFEDDEEPILGGDPEEGA